MTYHAILFTKDLKGFAWITEYSSFLGRGHENFATTEKITHLKEHAIAFSGWGDMAMMEAKTHFVNGIANGTLLLPDDDPESVKNALCNFATEVFTLWADKINPYELPDARGMIVATLGKKPRVYRLVIVRTPTCYEIHDQLNATAGDTTNPSNLFVRYYYPCSTKSLRELLGIGIHTVRLARALNTASVGEPGFPPTHISATTA